MRILQIIHSDSKGGAEKMCISLHNQLLKRNISSYVLSLKSLSPENTNNTERLLSLNVKWPLFNVLYIAKKIKELVKELKIEIVHSHLFSAQISTAICKVLFDLDCKLVTTEHSVVTRRRNRFLGKLIDLFIYSNYDKIICVSQGTQDSLCLWLDCNRITKKTSLIYNGINQPANKLEKAKPDNSKCILLSVGNIRECKNYERNVNAFTQIKEPYIEYWIAGDASNIKKSTLNVIKKDERIKLLGYLPDIQNIIKTADIFIHTPTHEAFGLAALEAMSEGLPMICSNIPGLIEVVSDPKTTYCKLVDPLNTKEIKDSIELLIKNKKARRELGESAKIHSRNFSMENTADKYTKTYMSVLQNEK